MSKKRKKKKVLSPRKTLTERRREALEQRKAIWSDIDVSKLYQDVRDLRGEAVPVETKWLYLITDYYVARLDDLGSYQFVRRMHPHKKTKTPKIYYKWKNQGVWVNNGYPAEGEFDYLVERMRKGKNAQYDVFPLEIFVPRTKKDEEGKDIFYDVEIVSLLKSGKEGFEYINFCGVDRRVSYWLHSEIIFKSDSDYIYGYDGWGFPVMCFNIEKDIVRDIDLKIWSNMFSWSAKKRGI